MQISEIENDIEGEQLFTYSRQVSHYKTWPAKICVPFFVTAHPWKSFIDRLRSSVLQCYFWTRFSVTL